MAGYLGNIPTPQATQTRDTFTATASQTSFATSGYTVGMLDVYLNGVKLSAADITATNGSDVVIAAASAGDILEVVSFSTFDSASGAFSVPITTTTAGTSNFRAGVNAGDAIQSGGNYNVVVGDEAGTAITTGDRNTAVGFEALKTATTASYCVAVGYQALENNTGNGNTAVGDQALEACVGGTNNTAMGDDAGVAVTSGQKNTFIGGSCGDATDDGSSNTAVGYLALSANCGDDNVAVGESAGEGITGSENTCVGRRAGEEIQSGTQNVCIGAGAGITLFSSAENVAVGYQALNAENSHGRNCAVGFGSMKVADTGATAYNTGLGYHSGVAVSTGVKNTCIGGLAGQSITTGDYNTIIGYSCDVSSGSVATSIVVGQSVTGVGTDNFTFGNGSTDSNIAFGATSITAPSDQRYKEDIETATAGLSFIKDLRPVTFKWKKEKDLPANHRAYVKDSDKRTINNKTNHGFLAQEVKAVIDAHSEIKDGFDMWQTDDQADGGRQRIGDASLMPMMVKAIQELSAKNDTLETQVADLITRVKALEDK